MPPNPLALESQSGHLPSSPLPPVGPRRPSSLSPSCFQRLTAIQQVLKAQKISFLLRGGVRVLVAMRDTDTGEGPGASPGLARACPCRVGWTCIPAPVTSGTGGRGLLLPGWSPPVTTGSGPRASLSTHRALALIYMDI